VNLDLFQLSSNQTVSQIASAAAAMLAKAVVASI
jgi:hypothetical protein